MNGEKRVRTNEMGAVRSMLCATIFGCKGMRQRHKMLSISECYDFFESSMGLQGDQVPGIIQAGPDLL